MTIKEVDAVKIITAATVSIAAKRQALDHAMVFAR